MIVDERDQTLPLREPIDVARGPFRVKATFAGKTKELSGEAKPGVVTTVALAFDAAGAEVTAPPDEPKPGSWTAGKTVGIVLWAGAAVGAGLGIGFTLAANNASDKVASARADPRIRTAACFGVTSADCQGRKGRREQPRVGYQRRGWILHRRRRLARGGNGRVLLAIVAQAAVPAEGGQV